MPHIRNPGFFHISSNVFFQEASHRRSVAERALRSGRATEARQAGLESPLRSGNHHLLVLYPVLLFVLKMHHQHSTGRLLKRSSDWLPACLSVCSLFYKVEALVRCFMVLPAEAEGRLSASGRLKVWFRSNLEQSGFNQSVMFIRTVMKWTGKNGRRRNSKEI